MSGHEWSCILSLRYVGRHGYQVDDELSIDVDRPIQQESVHAFFAHGSLGVSIFLSSNAPYVEVEPNDRQPPQRYDVLKFRFEAFLICPYI